MAALNFPPSPSTNQIYSANGKSWRFDGTSWKTFYILNVQGGGTGNTSYNLGDLLVGAGTSILTLPIGTNNYVLTVDTSTPSLLSWKSVSGISITNINGVSSSYQYFSVGSSGTNFNISSSGSTHTFNIPIAGSGATGLVSTDAQTFAGVKTFTSAIIGDLTGTATTAGFASTANYALSSGYGITSGFASTASYSYQSGYGITSGIASRAVSIDVNNAATNSSHSVILSPSASGSGIALSSNTTISFNPSTNILSISGLAVTSSTVSTSTSTGSVVISGGVGIGGSLFLSSSFPSNLSGIVVNNGVITAGSWSGNLITGFYGGTGYNSYTKGDILVGAGNTFIKLNVGTDNYVLTASSLSSTGLTWSPTSATGITTLNGLSANIQYFSFGYTGSVPSFSSSGSTHTLNIPIAGSGATGLVSTQSQTFAGVKTFTSTIIGDLSGTATTAGFASTSNYALTSGYGITSGFATTASYSYQSGYGITAGTASTANYSYQSGYGITSGFASTAANISVSNANLNSAHFLLFSPSSSGSGLAVSSNTAISFNPSSLVLSTSGLAVTSSTVSTSTSTGALTVSGGVGIGGSLYLTSSLPSSLSGVVVNNGVITTGSWAGSTITGFYGGTGYNSYAKGDILVGAGNTFIKLNVGTDNYVLTANSSSATGLTWSPTAATGITTLNGLSSSFQYFAFGYTGTVPAFSSVGLTHTLNIPLAGTGSTGLVSTQTQSFAGIKTFTNAVSITDNSGSSSYTNGALVIAGGVGVGGTLNVQGDLNVQGTFTTINSTTITVADKNIELGVVSSPSDLTAQGGGITLRGATDKSINWYSGVGWSSSESFNLAAGNSYQINGIAVLSNSSLGTGITNSNLTAVGTISTGVWAGTTITSFYGGTGYPTYTTGDLLVGAGSTLYKLPVGNNNFILTADSTVPGGIKWANVSGFAITTVNGLNASYQYFATGSSGTSFNISSSGSTHTFNIPIAGTGATGLVSTLAQSFAGVKTFTNDVIVSSTTGSTAFNTGSLTVYGGLGVSGQLSFNQAALGFTGATNPSIAFIGSTTAAPITLTVLSDNSLIWEGTSGKLFGINNNLSSGWIFNVGDISGLPIIRANADGTIAMAEFAANVGIGLSNPSYKLHVVGDTNLSSSYVYRINGVSVLSSASLGTGVTNSSLTAVGTLSTGVWAATAITSFYGGTGYQTYSTGDLLVGAGSTLYKLPVGTNNYVLTADNTAPGGVKWSVAASTGVTTVNNLTASIQYFATGTSGSGFNISSSGSTHTFNIPIAGTGATGLVSTLAQSFAGVKTFTNDTVISSSTVSTSTSTGALTITGGVGIGGSLFTGTSTADSISGVVLNNGVITSGSWSATAITARYGGTGNTSYTLGDLLVGAGSTFIKLPVGINSYVLGTDSSKPSGIGWTTVTPLTVSDTPPSSPKNADLWFNSLDGGLLVYYNDVDTAQWVEIALGSGIDLSQPVHITNTTPSTSTTTGALIVDGGVGIQGELHTSSLVINGTYDVIGSNVTLSTTATGQVINSLDASIYRSVKYMVQITHGTDYQVQEILLLHDSVDTFVTQYAQLLSTNNLILATYDADLSGGNMRLLVSPTFTNTTFKIYGTAVRV
jgi:hypothetical protein